MKLLDGRVLEDSEILNRHSLVKMRDGWVHNIELYAESFDKNGFIVVNDILCDDVAEELYSFLNVTMGEVKWWYRAFNSDGTAEYYIDDEANQDSISMALKRLDEVSGKDGFYYTFRRMLDNHFSGCRCSYCAFSPFLKSPKLLGFISKVIGDEVTGTGEVFGNYYGKGDFLGAHHDGMKGKVGFVLYLTKNWKPQYGGNLNLLTEDWLTVREVMVPGFNTLLMFRLPEDGRGIPHFVSPVQTELEKRLAISGWFK